MKIMISDNIIGIDAESFVIKIFDAIINRVGILEFPSDCKVSEKKLTNMNTYANVTIGIK